MLQQASKQVRVSGWLFSFTFDADYVITIKLSINDNFFVLLTKLVWRSFPPTTIVVFQQFINSSNYCRSVIWPGFSRHVRYIYVCPELEKLPEGTRYCHEDKRNYTLYCAYESQTQCIAVNFSWAFWTFESSLCPDITRKLCQRKSNNVFHQYHVLNANNSTNFMCLYRITK